VNQERLERWTEEEGFLVATSALGTGMDFPRVVFVLHVDVPYGMLDFARESECAERAGKYADSAIIWKKGG